MKKQNEIYPRSIADGIVQEFEEILEAYDIYVPDEDRTGGEGEACLYGSTYYGLVDVIEEYITEALNRMKENPGIEIVGGVY